MTVNSNHDQCFRCEVPLTEDNRGPRGAGYCCRECHNARTRAWQLANPERDMVSRAKARAKRKGIPFTITHEDITIPEHCPVLGIKLEPGSKYCARDSSPSLDRIIPELGYVPGNVEVISNRANKLKNDATPEELRLVAEYYS